MARRSRPTSQKRNKEMARQQKQKDKAARRLEAKERKTDAGSDVGGTDLDIAGIKPGHSLSRRSGIISGMRINCCGEEAHPGLPRYDA